MKTSLLRNALLSLACSLAPALAPAATLSWEPSSLSIVRGQVAYMDLRISGLLDDSVWSYHVNVTYDPSVIQLVTYFWGDGKGSNQLVCPGPTPETCTHIGSTYYISDWWTSQGHFYFAEVANGLNWWEENIDSIQVDDFVLLHLGFVGVEAGTTSLVAGGDYNSSAWYEHLHGLAGVAAPIEVMISEPASWLLGLFGLAPLIVRRRYLRRARGCAAS